MPPPILILFLAVTSSVIARQDRVLAFDMGTIQNFTLTVNGTERYYFPLDFLAKNINNTFMITQSDGSPLPTYVSYVESDKSLMVNTPPFLLVTLLLKVNATGPGG